MSPQPESGIPVLTEVLQKPVYGVDLPERRLAGGSAPAATTSGTPSATVVSDPVQRDDLVQEIRESVLNDLLQHIDRVLEDRIRDSLAEVLQSAVDRLACELRHGLKESLDVVVQEAAAQAVERRLGRQAP